MANQSVQVETLSQTITALIVGNTDNLGLFLARDLLSRGLGVTLVGPKSDYLDTHVFEQLLDLPEITHLSTYTNTTQPPHYGFFIFSPQNPNFESLDRFFSLFPISAKLAIISPPPLPDSDQESDFDRLQNLISSRLINHQQNLRFIVVNHLFGRAVTSKTNNPLTPIFLSTLGSTHPTFPSLNATIYPLHLASATQAIVKSLFSSDSIGKIFQLGGQPILVRDLVSQLQQLTEIPLTLPTPSSPQSHDQHHQELWQQIQATWQQLSWHPSADISTHLSETVSWYKAHPQLGFSQETKPNPETHSSTHSKVLPPSPTPPLTPIISKLATLKKSDQNHHLSTQPTPPPITQEIRQQLNPKIHQEPKPLSPPLITSTPNKDHKHFTLQSLGVPSKPKKSRRFRLPTNKPKNPRRQIVAFLGTLIILVLVVLTALLFFTQKLRVLPQLISSPPQEILSQTSFLNPTLNSTRLAFSVIQKPVSLVIGQQTTNSFQTQLNYAHSFSSSLNDLAQVQTSTGSLLQSLFDPNLTLDSSLLTKATSDSLKAFRSISQLEAYQKQSSQVGESSFLSHLNLDQASSKLTHVKSALFSQHQLFTQFGPIFSSSTPQRILVLVQDTSELRPTGGFITTYADLTLNQGKLISVEIGDVSSLDNKLLGHVEPPLAVKQFLGESSWFLRDVNWDPDTATTAKRVAWFYQKQTNFNVDYVLLLNSDLFALLLDITGPLSLPSISQPVNSQNYLSLQRNYLVASADQTQSDFLTLLFQHLFSSLSSSQTNYSLLSQALLQTLPQQPLTLYPLKPDDNQSLTQTHFTNSLTPTPCLSDPCHSAYFSLVEANVGVNKVNPFINRQVSHLLDFSQNNQVGETLQINFTNTADSSNWPLGSYKNYLRLYLPQSAQINTVKIGETALNEDQYDTSTQHNFLVLGLLLDVTPSSTTTLTVDYHLPLTPLKSTFNLNYFYDYQPGVSPHTFNLQIIPPSNYTPTSLPIQITNQDLLKFSQTVSSDQSFQFEFSPRQ